MAKAPVNQMGKIPIRWDEKRNRWVLSIIHDGKRTRSYHKIKTDALKAWTAHCNLIAKHGRMAAEYSPDIHREYLEARRIVGDVDLRDVARFYVEHQQVAGKSYKVSESIKIFLEAKSRSNLSERHYNTIRSHLSRFQKSFDSTLLTVISGNQILSWLLDIQRKGMDARTVRNYFLSLQNWLNWCVRRKMLKESPAASIDVSDLPVIPPASKMILSVDQAASMMEWIDNHRPHFAAWHAIQLFCGLRNAEAERMRWEWIDLDRKVVNLPGSMVKTGDNWSLYGLPDSFWCWMEKYHKGKGLLRGPANQTLSLLRESKFPQLKHPIERWPKNGMRHTFCTMMISLHGDAAKVALWSRHRNVSQLFNSYVTQLVSKEEAERYFAIVPSPANA